MLTGHVATSNVIASMDSPYMLSCLCLIVTYDLTAPLQDIRLQNPWFDLQVHLRSNVMVPFDSPYMISYWYIYSIHMSTSFTFQFIHRVQWWTINFGKKNIKNRKLEIEKIQNSTFVRNTEKKIQKRFEKIQKWFEGGVALWSFWLS